MFLLGDDGKAGGPEAGALTMAGVAGETLRQFLDRRERELAAQISALRGQLEPKEAELTQVRQMKALMTIAGSAALEAHAEHASQGVAPPLSSGSTEGVANRPIGVRPGPGPHPLDPPQVQAAINERFKEMTIKELVIQALLDHFPTGASAALIRDFIRDAYERVIQPSSLRPQLRRLQLSGILYHDPSSDLWNITSQWRSKYIRYNVPLSRIAVDELKSDEEPDLEEGVTRA